MTQPPQIAYHVLDTGYCVASEHHMIRGGQRRTVACHALVALLHHPQHGWFLWDTGYAPRMLDATRHFPFSVYRAMTPLRLQSDLAVVAQLPRFGLTTTEVKRVIISHFHADHLAGLHDFPHAQVIATHSAYADARSRRGVRALGRAIIPALLPPGLDTRMHFVRGFADPALPGLGPTHDLFGDGSIRLIDLPGHARGQIGMLVNSTNGPVLFAADGAWLSRSIRENRLPHPITYTVVDDRRAVATTLARLHTFARACPDVPLIPTHCPEAFAREVGQ